MTNRIECPRVKVTMTDRRGKELIFHFVDLRITPGPVDLPVPLGPFPFSVTNMRQQRPRIQQELQRTTSNGNEQTRTKAGEAQTSEGGTGESEPREGEQDPTGAKST